MDAQSLLRDRRIVARGIKSVLALACATAASVLTGCTPAQQTAARAGVGELPAYQDPSSIRPSGASVNPNPVPPPAAPLAKAQPAAPLKAPPAGPWAPPVAPRPWKYIVLHHSASPSGNAAVFDREHREKGWDELGYHFVIDNGQGGPDGRIEIGPRWRTQKWGAHAKTPDNKFNNFGIGICFVGNFEQTRPTPKQLASAARLVAWLEETYRIPTSNVIGHEDTGKQTLCPGKNLHVAQVRTLANAQIAELMSGSPLEWPFTSNFGGGSAEVPVVMHARIAAAPAEVELMQAR